MTALLTLLRDYVTGDPNCGIIATNTGATRVFSSDESDDQDLAEIYAPFMESGLERPTDATGWMRIGLINPGSLSQFGEPEEFPDEASAIASARAAVSAPKSDPNPDDYPSEHSSTVARAYDETELDHPGMLDEGPDGPDWDPDAFLNYVAMTLGPIDPSGPNGWVIRAQDGTPPPDDAQLDYYPTVTWPTQPAEGEPDEADSPGS